MATHDVCVVDDCKVSHHGYRSATMTLSSSPTYLNPPLLRLHFICYYYSSRLHKTFNSVLIPPDRMLLLFVSNVSKMVLLVVL